MTLREKFSKSMYDLEHILKKLGADETELTECLEHFADFEDEIDSIDRLLRDLGKTEFHSGTQDLPTRLDLIEGCLTILHMSHLNHSNTERAEFVNMHGFWPEIEPDKLDVRVFEVEHIGMAGTLVEVMPTSRAQYKEILKFLSATDFVSVRDPVDSYEVRTFWTGSFYLAYPGPVEDEAK